MSDASCRRPLTRICPWYDQGAINELRVGVDITHTCIGDLRVDLIAPDGRAVALYNHTGGSANDLVKTDSPQELPALRALLGKPIQGTWRLRVVDTFRIDVGRLNSWRIVARLAPPVPASPPVERAEHRGRPRREGKERAANREAPGRDVPRGIGPASFPASRASKGAGGPALPAAEFRVR